MAISVLVNGSRGRMGQEVVQAVRAEKDLNLVGETDLEDSLREAIVGTGADVVVDFTQPSAAVTNAETILQCGARPVVGTTGFLPQDITRLQALAEAKKLGGVIAPNFAIGAVLLMHFAALASRFLPDVEIVELHHDQKLDAPSGTAVKTAELIAESRSRDSPAASRREESITGVRGGLSSGVPIHSVRLPGLVAHQEVLLGGLGQLLSLRHDSMSRASFMPGVILAVRKAPELTRLHYGLENILEL